MKRLAIGAALIFVLAVVAIAYGQMGMMGGGYQGGGWYCPYCGQWMGRGMMGGGMMGSGMMGCGPGMMGGGMMGGGTMGPGYGQQYQQPQYQQPQYQQPQKPLEEKDAKETLENYIKNMRNPNLKLGKIKDTGTAFEAEILTKDNSLVDKIVVDKMTGWMRSAY